MQYSDLQARLVQLIGAPVTTSSPDFTAILPAIIDYAELRMQRDIDFLATRQTVAFTTTANNAYLNISTTPTFIVVENVSGAAGPLTPKSEDFIRLYSVSGAPTDYAFATNASLLLGPTPNAVYGINVTGTCRQTELSGSNATNFMSLFLPDLYLAAAMVFVSGWMKNYSAMSDDPQMGMTWEKQYQALKSAALAEEFRLKQLAAGFTNRLPDPVAEAVG